ncbi:MAG: hypothetical protein FJZ16_01295 [Candidatus Omnitrophica bacterium]|nr:hypothetical protein [Candidatus Omnitrophota bacterium]
MAFARRVKQIVAVTPNRIGMFAELSSAISDISVNIIALCAYGVADKANFMIITDNNQRAISALKAKRYEVVKEEDVGVISLPNRIGEARHLADKFAKANINLEYCYGTTGDSKESLFVFATKELDKAIEVLNK